ncbi:class I SAM-dependent methyltransferase [Sphingomonas sp. HF-S4]|uniref:Class I SAM-dependent methyltransferase n=1 Tax=Sphingomonas agrestis TaxID=3080540 RepID=A0ABU3Y618_9SPHN|nr:class I SAM-dependent methyltransferase [Sphingomonas sp. HF-S4]MDV3456850.1 class I SAM-dependent methyltransferase [Sphingomonas sp. HF-S4]
MRPITLDGFEAKFAADPDPWFTFSDRDEAHKRQAILHALGSGKRGRILELAAGNGSNSATLARRTLRLDATEGTAEGTALVAKAIADCPGARALRLALPDPFPSPRYDAIIVAEVLYYLTARVMAETARRVSRALPVGGRLVLAHHRIDFHDFVQHAAGIHADFLRDTGARWHVLSEVRTGRWIVQGLAKAPAGP